MAIALPVRCSSSARTSTFSSTRRYQCPDAEADEQEALADPLERADQAAGQRRPLGDDGDQEVEQIVLAQNERAGFLRIAEQVIDQRALGRARQQELGVVALVAAQVVALTIGSLPAAWSARASRSSWQVVRIRLNGSAASAACTSDGAKRGDL